MDRPLTRAGATIISQVMEGELGRAELSARKALSKDPGDVVPAHLLGQIVRVRKKALAEYRAESPGWKPNATLPVLIYRLQLSRIARDELHRQARFDSNESVKILEAMERVRDQCVPIAGDSLGAVIVLSQVSPWWIVTSRRLLDDYAVSHPRIDIRPLRCQAYISGLIFKPIGDQKARSEIEGYRRVPDPRESQPLKAVQIASSLIKDDPKSSLGHFYLGSAYFRLNQVPGARKEMRLALDLGTLPPVYETAAESFLQNPSLGALRPQIPY